MDCEDQAHDIGLGGVGMSRDERRGRILGRGELMLDSSQSGNSVDSKSHTTTTLIYLVHPARHVISIFTIYLLPIFIGQRPPQLAVAVVGRECRAGRGRG